MKKILPVLFLAGLLVTLAACGGSSVTESTIEVSRKGTVTQTTIGTIDGEYYDSDELKSFLKDQVESYQDSASAVGTVKLKNYSYSSSDQTVTIILTFSDADTYADFENLTFFSGTVDEAKEAGYTFAVSLIAAEDAPAASEMETDSSGNAQTQDASGDAADGTAGLGLSGDEKVIILQESYHLTIPGEVLYVTEDACGIVSEDTVSVNAEAADLVYIIYE